MSLNKIINASIRWSYSVGIKLVRVVPFYTLAVVLATLTSQVALLLASILPIKVLFLLGSTGVPRYFPQAWQTVDHDHLVMSLAAGTLGFYLLYLLAEKTAFFYAEQGAHRLLEKSRKISLFENQSEIAKRAYHRYSRSLAGLVFVGLSLVFTGVLYPYLVLVVLAYSLIVYVLLLVASSLSERLRTKIEKDFHDLIKMLGTVGFLLAFAFMITDFLTGEPPSVIVAIVCLLLVRQLMLWVAGAITDLSSLFAQRLQINALFFHGQKFITDIPRFDQAFWPLLEMPRRNEWVMGVLREVAGVEPKHIASTWMQTAIANVATMEVTARYDSSQNQEPYLIKLFNSNNQSIALHEASLLSECESGSLPSPQFLGADQVEQYHCHLFKWTGVKELSASELGVKRQEIAVRLMSYEPPKALLERYCRSRPLLWQRLNNDMIKRLRLISSDPQQLGNLTLLDQNLDQIRSRLQSLPVQILNPDTQPDILKCTEDGTAYLTHWGRWSIEPAGAGWPVPGWPVSENDLDSLSKALNQAKESRKTLATVIDADIRLAALMFYFEALYNRQHYVNAMKILPSVLACIESSDVDPRVE